MRPDSTDFVTWALVALLLSKHAEGAVGGMWIVAAVAALIAGPVSERRRERTGAQR